MAKGLTFCIVVLQKLNNKTKTYSLIDMHHQKDLKRRPKTKTKHNKFGRHAQRKRSKTQPEHVNLKKTYLNGRNDTTMVEIASIVAMEAEDVGGAVQNAE